MSSSKVDPNTQAERGFDVPVGTVLWAYDPEAEKAVEILQVRDK